jgi:hypothetical protein
MKRAGWMSLLLLVCSAVSLTGCPSNPFVKYTVTLYNAAAADVTSVRYILAGTGQVSDEPNVLTDMVEEGEIYSLRDLDSGTYQFQVSFSQNNQVVDVILFEVNVNQDRTVSFVFDAFLTHHVAIIDPFLNKGVDLDPEAPLYLAE